VVFTKQPSNLLMESAKEVLAEASIELESQGSSAAEFDGLLIENFSNYADLSTFSNLFFKHSSFVTSITFSLVPSRAPPKLS